MVWHRATYKSKGIVMKAMVITNYGPTGHFEIREVPRPSVGPGQVLIQVKASSVNPVDFKIRSGLLPGIAPVLPAILHGDMAGIVAEVGEAVSEWFVGDEVYGFVGGIGKTHGVIAEYAVVDARQLAKKPARLSFAEAAALPLVSITAWEALIDKVRIMPGDHVLIHGGTGGVGHIGLQLAKLQGARVAVSVSSPSKGELARQLGADDIVVYQEEDVSSYVRRLTEGQGFDVVFDTVGGEVLDRSIEAIRTLGQVVSTSTHSKHDLSFLHQKGASLHVVFMLLPLLGGSGLAHHGEIVGRLSEIVDRGALRPLIDSQRFFFSNVGSAHSYLESGAAIGKVVLENDFLAATHQ